MLFRSNEGFWVFTDFRREGDPDVLRVDWTAASESDARLDLENIDAANPDFGDELGYLTEGSGRSMEFFDASNDMTWDIRWNQADGSGSLMVPGYNGGQRSCWDENQEDTSCAAASPAE